MVKRKQVSVSIVVAKDGLMNEMQIYKPVKETVMNNVFVGDVHARPELVISAIEMAAGRKVIFLGDIFDGPGGAQGAKECLDLIRASGSEMILGNHELCPLFFGESQEELAKAWGIHYDLSQEDQERIWNEWQELRGLLTNDDMSWLRSRPLWIKGKTWTAVHAKLPVGKLPPRFVKNKPTAAQIELVDNTDPDDFWAKDYKGRHGLAIVGHTRRSKVPGYKCSWDHVRLIDWDAKKGGPGCVYFLEEDNMSEIMNQPEPTPPPPPENTMAFRFRIALDAFIRLLSQDVKIAAMCGITEAGINPYHTERPMKNKKSRPPKDIVMRKSKSPRPHKDPAMSRMSRRQRRRLLHLWRKRAGVKFAGLSVPRPKPEYIYTEKYKLPGGRRSAPPAYIHVASTAAKKKSGGGERKTGPAFNTKARRQAALDRKRTHLTRPQDPVKASIAKRKAENKRNELPILRVQVKPIVAKPVVIAAKVKVVRFDDYLDATRLVKAAFGPRKANTGVKTLDRDLRHERRAAAAKNVAMDRLLKKQAIHNEWVAQNPAQVAAQAPAAKAARLAVEAEVKAAQAAALAKIDAEKKATQAEVARIRKAMALRKAQELADHRAAKSAKKAAAKSMKSKGGITVVTTIAPVAKAQGKKVVVVMTKPAANPDAKHASNAPAKPRLGTGCSFVSLPHNLRKEINVVKFGRPTAPVREHAQVTLEELKAVAKFRKPVVATVPVAEAEPRPSLLLRLFELLPGAAPAPAPVAIPAPAPVAKPKANAEPQSLLLRLLELLPSTPSKLTVEEAADALVAQLIGIEAELRDDVPDEGEAQWIRAAIAGGATPSEAAEQYARKCRKERAMSHLVEAGDLHCTTPEPEQVEAMAKLGIYPATEAETLVLPDRYERWYDLRCEEVEVGTKVRVSHCGWKTEDGIIVRPRVWPSRSEGIVVNGKLVKEEVNQ